MRPSHDEASDIALVDFKVNAPGTVHLLEAVRQHCLDAFFIFVSTNKVYGDAPNEKPLVETEPATNGSTLLPTTIYFLIARNKDHREGTNYLAVPREKQERLLSRYHQTLLPRTLGQQDT